MTPGPSPHRPRAAGPAVARGPSPLHHRPWAGCGSLGPSPRPRPRPGSRTSIRPGSRICSSTRPGPGTSSGMRPGSGIRDSTRPSPGTSSGIRPGSDQDQHSTGLGPDRPWGTGGIPIRTSRPTGGNRGQDGRLRGRRRRRRAPRPAVRGAPFVPPAVRPRSESLRSTPPRSNALGSAARRPRCLPRRRPPRRCHHAGTQGRPRAAACAQAVAFSTRRRRGVMATLSTER